jgi:hypothetical protein
MPMSEWQHQPEPEDNDITPVTRAEYEALVRTVESFTLVEGATEEISISDNERINDIGFFVNIARIYGQSAEETENLAQDRITLYFGLRSAGGENANITVEAGEGRSTEVTIYDYDGEKITGLDRDTEIIVAKAAADLARCLLIDRHGPDANMPLTLAYLDTSYGAISTILKAGPKAYAKKIMADFNFNDTRVTSWNRYVKRLASEAAIALRTQKAGYFTNTKTFQVEESPNTQIEFSSTTTVNYDADLKATAFRERIIKLNVYYKSLISGSISVIEESVSLILHENTAKIEKGTADITNLGYADLDETEIELPEREYHGRNLDNFSVTERDADQLEIGLFSSKIAFARSRLGIS